MWLVCCFVLYLCVQLQVFLFSLYTRQKEPIGNLACKGFVGEREYLRFFKNYSNVQLCRRTQQGLPMKDHYLGTLQTLLCYNWLNVLRMSVACQKQPDLSVMQVAPPSRHLPTYYVYLSKFVSKNINRPTVCLFVCFYGFTTHFVCIFHSPVTGFSILVFEIFCLHTTTLQSR
jgi:hypothetical protein